MIVFSVLFLALQLGKRLSPARPVTFFSASSITLIIDPGHGGADGGASVNQVLESKLNLDIALKLDQIMGLFSAPVILTRDSEALSYPADADTIREKKIADQKHRIDLINGTDKAVVISIHQNKYSDEAPRGAQVFFSEYSGSEDFALITHEYLKAALDPLNRRQARRIANEIFLMRKIHCPAILVECGFMSNPSEFALLQTQGYQTKIAVALAAAYMCAAPVLEELYGKS